MSQATPSELRLLDHCLTDREAVKRIRGFLEKLEKCCDAVERQVNLGEIVCDPANRDSLAKLLGPEGLGIGLQLLLKLALKNHHSLSFTVHSTLEGPRKLEFLHRSVAAWKQFDIVLQVSGPQPVVINPRKSEHWRKIERIPAGTLVTVHLKTAQGARVHAEEQLAAERFAAVFDTVQNQPADVPADTLPRPVAATAAVKPPPFRRPLHRTPAFTTAGPPVMDLSVTINKIDTFIHAGNAHLIVNHVKDYPGKVTFYVLRGAKKKVSLDADSIWTAEIRNGETVLFEFHGPMPDPRFLKELARSVNKYTQMDKAVNE